MLNNHHIHNSHNIKHMFGNLIHDSRFWIILGILAFFVLLIILAAIAEPGRFNSAYPNFYMPYSY
jgi:hypothetical protein